jgi:sugar lactone lactonase YvrE
MTEQIVATTTLLSGLAMGESARWHDGRFWCSDWVAGEILAVGLDGSVEVVARSTSFPFCFDWQPDGTMLVTSATGLERLQPGERGTPGAFVPAVDLSR